MLLSFFLLIFIVIILINIYSYNKTNNKLDIIKVDNIRDKANFESVSRLLQIVVFRNKIYYDLESILKNDKENIFIRNKMNDYIPTKLNFLENLLKENPNYYSENNHLFIEDKLDVDEQSFLKPVLSIYKRNDLIIGNKGLEYPIKKMYHYRNIFYILEGKCKFTLYSPNNNFSESETKFNKKIFEESLILDSNKGYKHVNVELSKGDYILVPPHWFLDIAFLEKSYIISSYFHTPFSFMSNMLYYYSHFMELYRS